MCGFAGFLDIGSDTPDRERTVRAMADTLVRRGPDATSVWVEDGAGIALAHRRLPLADRDARLLQPLQSRDGRWVVAFDGEIFNRVELRHRLAPVETRTESCAELLLEAVARWGVERALAAFDGAFAIALWDRLERALYLVRDRMGEKPLYWSLCGGVLMFGSELKALKRHPAFDRAIDRNALAAYLKLGWVPSPHTIYAAARKLAPGTLLTVRGRDHMVRPYWSAAERAQAVAGSFTGGRAAAAERLNQLLRGAVSLRMQADAPMGVLLSGGVDSSLTAALAGELSSGPVHTFTIGFDEQGYDESPHARAVAEHLGTRHTEVRMGDEDAAALLPDLPAIWDEPFGDPAQLPACLLAAATRREVAVTLSGEGADELFGGYGLYRTLPDDWQRAQAQPGWLRALARGAAVLPPGPLNGLAALAERQRRSYPGYRLRRWGETMSAATPRALLGLARSRWRGAVPLVAGAHPVASVYGAAPAAFADPALALMVADVLGELGDGLLVRADRAAASVSLEARLPFLDPAVAEFAWSLPTALKIDGGEGKAVVRDVLDHYLPRSLVGRPQRNFDAPVGRWLNGRLGEWAGDLLSEGLLRRQGLLNPGPVVQCWHDHRVGLCNWQGELWHVLMFQAWLAAENAFS